LVVRTDEGGIGEESGVAVAAVLTGTKGPDAISGTVDDDSITGLGGDDLLAGDPSLFGAGGDDALSCGPGNNRAYTDGTDLIAGDCEEITRGPHPDAWDRSPFQPAPLGR
jgi:hypothetical protein